MYYLIIISSCIANTSYDLAIRQCEKPHVLVLFCLRIPARHYSHDQLKGDHCHDICS